MNSPPTRRNTAPPPTRPATTAYMGGFPGGRHKADGGGGGGGGPAGDAAGTVGLRPGHDRDGGGPGACGGREAVLSAQRRALRDRHPLGASHLARLANALVIVRARKLN